MEKSELPFSSKTYRLLNVCRSTIRLTVENTSELPIDFIKLSFDDSTMIPAQQALGDSDLPISEVYEIEHDLINRPVFSWDPTVKYNVGPGKQAIVTVTCLGKVGWYVYPILCVKRVD